MRTADFDYLLPEELIAQHPAPDRDGSRLMALPRDPAAPPRHHRFPDLPDLVPAGALLVLNDTRVIPARLHGHKPTGGRIELLLLSPAPAAGEDAWLCLYSAAKPLKPGVRILLDRDPAAEAEVVARTEEGRVTCRFHVAGGFAAALDRLGEVPLPPYIRRPAGEEPDDRERYQTVYARAPGAVAAPTAGLHFTTPLLDRLRAGGVTTATVTLHVGPGTFAPVRADDLAGHRMHAEAFEVPAATAAAVHAAAAGGRPVVAVGTTVVRALESAADDDGTVRPGAGATALFITPGYRFKVVRGLVTNFHLPRSTLLMLVSALCGRERLLAAYAEAVAQRYRFYSYGDAMLVLP
ncbi:MAG TPA: tRNA preQ1(34) S-adenosylmethionine ribosyltransferase-isomerase QueA [Polyangia bacterium]|jgi:S-adenosylmethionine:tRNA ribosyltransferase-isomerase